MTDQAVDYSSNRPAPDDIVAGGYVGAMRYLRRGGGHIDVDEARALAAAGLRVGLVYETAADRVLGGAAAGDADGREAAREIKALGWMGRIVFSAVDFQIWPDQYGTADAYFDAFGVSLADELGGWPVTVTVEPYGTYDYIEHWCERAGVDRGGWQTAAWSGMGEGTGGSIDGRRLSKYARLYQRVGYVLNDTCDANVVLAAGWGWHPDDDTQTPTPPVEDDEVALSNDIIAVDLAYAAKGRAGDSDGIAFWHDRLAAAKSPAERDAILADMIHKLNGGP